jgi:hypothetical protein
MQVSSPYTTVGDYYCAAGGWTFALSGTSS